MVMVGYREKGKKGQWKKENGAKDKRWEEKGVSGCWDGEKEREGKERNMKEGGREKMTK